MNIQHLIYLYNEVNQTKYNVDVTAHRWSITIIISSSRRSNSNKRRKLSLSNAQIAANRWVKSQARVRTKYFETKCMRAFFTCSFNVCIYFKLDCEEVEITSGADWRLVSRPGQDARQIRVRNSRALRLSAPTSRHCTWDSNREHPQRIQHADDRDRRVRARMLVELGVDQGVHRELCQRCKQADESVPRRKACISSKSPGKLHSVDISFSFWMGKYIFLLFSVYSFGFYKSLVFL